jgi:hypothetical protein
MDPSTEESASNLSTPIDIDLLSFIEKKCVEYFQPDYLSLKSLLNQNGIVDDVLKEIAKYFQWPSKENIPYEEDGVKKIQVAWSVLKPYYTVNPFSFNDYMRFVVNNYTTDQHILRTSLPSSEIIFHEYIDCFDDSGESYECLLRLYRFEDYIITEKQQGVELSLNFNKMTFDDIYHQDGIKNLKHLIKTFKAYDAKTFDYYQYIVDNLDDFSSIMDVLLHFERDNLQEAVMKVHKLLKKKK